MRTMTLLLCLGLAGCAGAGASTSTSFAPEPPKTAAVADPPLLPSPAGEPAQSKHGRGKSKTAHADDSKDEWWKDGGVTREKINAMCWMKFEKGHGDLPIDKRADLVNQCVAETLKEHPLN